MRIFIADPSDYLTDCDPHGDGLLAWEFIRRLASRGHTLHVAYTAARIEAELPANITLHRIANRLPSARLREIALMIAVRRVFNQVRRSHSIDVIHQLNPVLRGRSALLAGLGIPLVLGCFLPSWPDSAGSTIPTRASRLAAKVFGPVIQWADRRQQRLAAKLLLSTQAARPSLHSPEGESARVEILQFGVDADEFTPAGEPASAAHFAAGRVLYLGSLERRKGVCVLAEAFVRVCGIHPGAKMIVAGEGAEGGAMREIFARHGVFDRVEFVGRVARQDVPSTMRAASLVVVPSLGEPFGMVALEAMSCGRAVIGTEAGGLAHLIVPEGGRLVAPDNIDALATALTELLSNPKRLMAMGEFNRQRALTEFAWPLIIDRLEAVYGELLSQDRKPTIPIQRCDNDPVVV